MSPAAPYRFVLIPIWLGELWRDLLLAARGLRRTPIFTATIVLSLGLGMALAASALAVANAYLFGALPYAGVDRLYHLRYAPPGPYEPRGMNGIDWTALRDVVEAPIASGGESFYLGEGTAVQFVRGLRASSGLISGLGVRLSLGRAFADEDFREGAPMTALLGHALWRERFGSDPDIIGRELKATPDNPTATPVLLRVIGVLPPGFWFGRTSQDRPDVMVPLRAVARPYMLRLREGVPVALAESRITEAARAVGTDFRPDWRGVTLEPVHTRYVAELRPLLLGVAASALLVLVLISTNVAILVLLRALRRQKELAVRLALGAERWHLLRLLLAEAALLCGASLALGVAATAVAVRSLGARIETELGKPPPAGPDAIGIDGHVALTMGGLAILLTLAMSVVPLLASREGKLANALRGSGFGATDAPAMRRVRATLIALEMAGALVLLAAGGVMVRTVLNFVRADLGFEPDKVARMMIVLPARYRERPMMARFYEQLAARVEQVHPAATVTSSFPPFYPTNQRPIEWTDSGEGRELSAGVLPIGSNYFATRGIALLQGRDFTSSDGIETEPVAIVSESLARHLWPDSSALGRHVRTTDESAPDVTRAPWRRIVGIARDVSQTYADDDRRDLYLPFLQTPTRFGNVQFRIDRAAASAPAQLGKIVTELDPYVRVTEPRLLTSEDRQFARARFMTLLMSSFAALGTALTLLGVYGTTAYAVQQREREVAIRLAIGATRTKVVSLFLRESGVVIAFGFCLGVGGTMAATRMLESQIHGVSPFDLPSLALAGGFLVGSALFATWWPARRAANADLTRILKLE